MKLVIPSDSLKFPEAQELFKKFTNPESNNLENMNFHPSKIGKKLISSFRM